MTRLWKLARNLLWGGVIVTILFVAAMAYLSPETTTVTSNAETPVYVNPTTTHRFTPTTVAPLVTAELATDELILVDGTRVYRLPRTPAVMLALYIATAGSR